MNDLIFVAMTFTGSVIAFVILVGGLAIYMNWSDKRGPK